jgi:hypothetical protein
MVRRCEERCWAVRDIHFRLHWVALFGSRSCYVPGVYGTKAWAYMLVSTAVGLLRNLLSQFGKIILSFRRVL